MEPSVNPLQVFAQYEPVETVGLQHYRFCPGCGTPIADELSTGRYVCPRCGFVMRSRTSTGVAVIATDGGERFVLCRRGPGSFGEGAWGLPQGGIEYGEDILTAALREVKEETNLDVRITRLLSVSSNFLRPGSHSLVIVLAAEVLGGELRAGDDADAAGWFTRGEALPELAFDADRHVIGRYFADPSAGAAVDSRFSAGRIEA
jgi:ADP-ribose pyrophosphatase YjhB (NUDIX family)